MSGPGPDYVPSGNERGHAPFDISMILTRHGNGTIKTAHHDFGVCARVLELRRSASQGIPAHTRLQLALAVVCSCGAGDAESEQTSLLVGKERRAVS